MYWRLILRGRRSGKVVDDQAVAGNCLPIVVIGGFLGAGKTTLINRVLTESRGSRFVVFVNDFGAINIDIDLIDTVAEDRISLKNGCVCCSLNDDLVNKIADLAKLDFPPDGVFIEASGVADPRSFSTSFNALEAAGLARLDVSVYVLDAENFYRMSYEDGEEIIDHGASSDLIVLNKMDVADSVRIKSLEATLVQSAPYTRILPTSYCDIPLEIIGNFPSSARWTQLQGPSNTGNEADSGVDSRVNSKVDSGSNRPDSGDDVDNGRDRMNHLHKYDKWSYETNYLVNRNEFEKFVQRLPDQCIRAKGFLGFLDEPEQEYYFSFVGFRASLEKSTKVRPPDSCRIIAIGYRDRLQKERLTRAFAALFSDVGMMA
ncbi:MAG: hypothetical protein GKR95_06980 [Gammaproteobacteria bacterium]|nr:hypothetical protein [Gammaproteobacteria bacterium]